MLRMIYRKELQLMSLSQQILDAIQATNDSHAALMNSVTQLQATTDQILAAIGKFVDAGSITPADAAQILGTLVSDKASADAALTAAVAVNQKLADEITVLNPPPPPVVAAGPVDPPPAPVQ
jgi:hypothetical protein